ncbi:MAG: hypothetical protein U9N40_04480 [Euryarchaeota archaeon]|nr:hypothetical protein [Euryarchaeota archaeon]
MKGIPEQYKSRIMPLGKSVDEPTGHKIASTLISFRMDLYDRVIEQADNAINRLEKKGNEFGVIKKSLQIVREEAKKLVGSKSSVKSQYTWEGETASEEYEYKDDTSRIELTFEEDEIKYLPIQLPETDVEVRETYNRDNALILLYVVASISSPYDESALDEYMKKYSLLKMKHYLEK